MKPTLQSFLLTNLDKWTGSGNPDYQGHVSESSLIGWAARDFFFLPHIWPFKKRQVAAVTTALKRLTLVGSIVCRATSDDGVWSVPNWFEGSCSRAYRISWWVAPTPFFKELIESESREALGFAPMTKTIVARIKHERAAGLVRIVSDDQVPG